MGVKDLWALLAPTGTHIPLSTLATRRLAVDASIWLTTFIKAMTDPNGQPLPGAHIQGMFHRLCCLLAYGVRPVIVFDGPAPSLKRKTLQQRRTQRRVAQSRAASSAEQILLQRLSLKRIGELRKKVAEAQKLTAAGGSAPVASDDGSGSAGATLPGFPPDSPPPSPRALARARARKGASGAARLLARARRAGAAGAAGAGAGTGRGGSSRKDRRRRKRAAAAQFEALTLEGLGSDAAALSGTAFHDDDDEEEEDNDDDGTWNGLGNSDDDDDEEEEEEEDEDDDSDSDLVVTADEAAHWRAFESSVLAPYAALAPDSTEAAAAAKAAKATTAGVKARGRAAAVAAMAASASAAARTVPSMASGSDVVAVGSAPVSLDEISLDDDKDDANDDGGAAAKTTGDASDSDMLGGLLSDFDENDNGDGLGGGGGVDTATISRALAVTAAAAAAGVDAAAPKTSKTKQQNAVSDSDSDDDDVANARLPVHVLRERAQTKRRQQLQALVDARVTGARPQLQQKARRSLEDDDEEEEEEEQQVPPTTVDVDDHDGFGAGGEQWRNIMRRAERHTLTPAELAALPLSVQYDVLELQRDLAKRETGRAAFDALRASAVAAPGQFSSQQVALFLEASRTLNEVERIRQKRLSAHRLKGLGGGDGDDGQGQGGVTALPVAGEKGRTVLYTSAASAAAAAAAAAAANAASNASGQTAGEVADAIVSQSSRRRAEARLAAAAAGTMRGFDHAGIVAGELRPHGAAQQQQQQQQRQKALAQGAVRGRGGRRHAIRERLHKLIRASRGDDSDDNPTDNQQQQLAAAEAEADAETRTAARAAVASMLRIQQQVKIEPAAADEKEEDDDGGLGIMGSGAALMGDASAEATTASDEEDPASVKRETAPVAAAAAADPDVLALLAGLDDDVVDVDQDRAPVVVKEEAHSTEAGNGDSSASTGIEAGKDDESSEWSDGVDIGVDDKDGAGGKEGMDDQKDDKEGAEEDKAAAAALAASMRAAFGHLLASAGSPVDGVDAEAIAAALAAMPPPAPSVSSVGKEESDESAWDSDSNVPARTLPGATIDLATDSDGDIPVAVKEPAPIPMADDSSDDEDPSVLVPPPPSSPPKTSNSDDEEPSVLIPPPPKTSDSDDEGPSVLVSPPPAVTSSSQPSDLSQVSASQLPPELEPASPVRTRLAPIITTPPVAANPSVADAQSAWAARSTLDTLRSLEELQDSMRAAASEAAADAKAAGAASATVTSAMVSEVKTLLQLMGVPYIDAPAEAEAQCAVLEQLGLVDGVVTDDSDIFVFGGRRVFRNMFDRKRYVELYTTDAIERDLGLDRARLIAMAMLLGSDYTAGVKNVGKVTAIEIVSVFPGGAEGLRQFREWVYSGSHCPRPTLNPDDLDGMSEADRTAMLFEYRRALFKYRHRNSRSRWEVPLSFPEEAVMNAYINPVADRSTERFTWGRIDPPAIATFLTQHLGWDTKAVAAALKPVVDAQRGAGGDITQTRLLAYYGPTGKFANIASKRVKKAVQFLAGDRTTTGAAVNRARAEAAAFTAARGDIDEFRREADARAKASAEAVAAAKEAGQAVAGLVDEDDDDTAGLVDDTPFADADEAFASANRGRRRVAVSSLITRHRADYASRLTPEEAEDLAAFLKTGTKPKPKGKGKDKGKTKAKKSRLATSDSSAPSSTKPSPNKKKAADAILAGDPVAAGAAMDAEESESEGD